jgi:hypothetical protein
MAVEMGEVSLHLPGSVCRGLIGGGGGGGGTVAGIPMIEETFQ